jgi:hypothetical protein
MKVFLAGIMQGSILGGEIHDQGYRNQIRSLVRNCLPGAEIVDPLELHPNSPSYDDERGRETFFGLCEMAGRVDLLIAYLPEASMGTAVEMWQAYRHGVPVISLSSMVQNWVVRFLSDRVCYSLEELEMVLRQGSEVLLPADR